MDVIFVVGVANIAVTLAVDVVCVITVAVVAFVVDTKGMTVDVTFKVVMFAVGNVVVGAVALVGCVTVVDKVALVFNFCCYVWSTRSFGKRSCTNISRGSIGSDSYRHSWRIGSNRRFCRRNENVICVKHRLTTVTGGRSRR